MISPGHSTLIITALFWLWSLPSLPGLRLKIANLHGLTHMAFALALLIEAWPWSNLGPWARAIAALICGVAYVTHSILTKSSPEDFWAKRRNRVAASLVTFVIAAGLALWCDPPHQALLFATAVYAGVKTRRSHSLSEHQADTDAMREKILALNARLHNQGLNNQELTDRAA
jgi:hypothetical protein